MAFFVSVFAGVISRAAMALLVTVGERLVRVLRADLSLGVQGASWCEEGVPGAASSWLFSLALGSLLAAELWMAQGPRTRILWLLTSPGYTLLKGLGSRCCARAGTGLSRDPLCSFLISLQRTVNERSGPNSCLVFIPVCSLAPWRREDGSGDKPNPGASVVYHRLWILWQPPD